MSEIITYIIPSTAIKFHLRMTFRKLSLCINVSSIIVLLIIIHTEAGNFLTCYVTKIVPSPRIYATIT